MAGAVLWIQIRIRIDPHWSALIWLSCIRIRIHIGNVNPDSNPGSRKLAKLANKHYFQPFLKLSYLWTYVLWFITYLKCSFRVKKSAFHDCKVWPGSGSRSTWIRIGLAPWIHIRIRIEVKNWIRIRVRIETNADPQRWHGIVSLLWILTSADILAKGEMIVDFFKIINLWIQSRGRLLKDRCPMCTSLWVQRPNSWTKSRQTSQEFSSLLFTAASTALPLRFLFLQTHASS
jgi:hypothetical protein